MKAKLTHALLASKRCLIDLQWMPFWSLTNALLKSNQAPFTNDLTTNWLTAGYKPVFCMRFLYLQMIRLNLCNGFSKSYLYFNVLKWKGLCIGGWWQDRQLTVLAMFLLNESLRFFHESYVKSIHALNGRIWKYRYRSPFHPLLLRL